MNLIQTSIFISLWHSLIMILSNSMLSTFIIWNYTSKKCFSLLHVFIHFYTCQCGIIESSFILVKTLCYHYIFFSKTVSDLDSASPNKLARVSFLLGLNHFPRTSSLHTTEIPSRLTVYYLGPRISWTSRALTYF